MLDAICPRRPSRPETGGGRAGDAGALRRGRPALPPAVDRPARRAPPGARHPRSFRSRQDDPPALPQPADRPDAAASPFRGRSCSTAAPSTAGSGRRRAAHAGRHALPAAGGLSRQHRRQRPVRRPAHPAALPPRVAGADRAGAPRGRPLGRGPPPPPRAGGEPLRAASSSASALPARWPGEPEVLLLDEPTSALDAGSTAAIEELILRLRERHAIVLVTHGLRQARRVADSLVYLAVRDGAGEVVESGPCRISSRGHARRSWPAISPGSPHERPPGRPELARHPLVPGRGHGVQPGLHPLLRLLLADQPHPRDADASPRWRATWTRPPGSGCASTTSPAASRS